jgi:hypothetical protein
MPSKPAPPDPDKLVRQSAGSYRTGDDRFEVRGEPNRWFLVDTQQSDELGQELVRGPFATLDEVREAVPGARRATAKPLAGPRRRATGKPAKPKPAPPRERSWIDRLPGDEQAAVRRLVGALQREGIHDAEQLVRRDREGLAPEVARRLLQQRLEALVGDVPPDDREAARALLGRVVRVLTAEGVGRRGTLPGWALVEVGPEPMPQNRRITLEA